LIGGGGEAGAAQATASLIGRGATSLLSFGFAGGLDPALPAGALVIPRLVMDHGSVWPVDAGMLRWLGGASVDRLLSGSAIATTADAKAALWRQSGAAAIDVESGPLARAAAAASLPFAVLRAVSDPATSSLPPAALAAVDDKGQVAPLRLLVALVANPGQIGAMWQLAQDARAARRALTGRLARLRDEG
jgi:adenosylhomocysteine nucleosidase